MKTAIRRRATLGALAFGAAALLAVAAPLSASAHVTLEENTATPGTSTTLTFRVPNETADDASTDKVTLTLPSGDGLLASVRYIPVPGWTTELVTTKLATPITNGDRTITQAVTQVIWTADPGSDYGPGSQGIFRLYVGPIPDVGQLKLPVDQGYSDGSVISWSGGTDAEHPAPVLYVNDPPIARGGASAATVSPAPSNSATASSAAAAAAPDVLARVLGGLGLVLGVIALVIAAAGRRPQKMVG